MSKAAIVTGASSGIGLAISRVLCEKGYEVYGFGRDFAKEQTREFVEQTAAFHPVEGDLLEEQKLCDAVKEITKTADIEVLVNAAGVGHYGLHEELTPKKIQALVRTNLEIPLLLTNRLLRVLKKNHGYIINISSVTAKQSSPHGCAYAATKAGLSSFGKSLFEEARKYGVKVTTIHPDMTDTNLYRDADFTCGEEPESYLLPDEVAKAVAYVLDQREGMVVPEITLRPQLHRIARPMNTGHIVMLVGVIAGWILCMLFGRSFFGITEISKQCEMLMVIFAIITEPVLRYLSLIVEWISARCRMIHARFSRA